MKSWNVRRAMLPMLLAIFAGSAGAAPINCKVTPEYTIVAEGQAVDLSAQCDQSLDSANWKMDGVSVTDNVSLAQASGSWNCDIANPAAGSCPPPVKFTTPVVMDAAGNGVTYLFSMAGVGLAPQDAATSNSAKVVVQPTNTIAAAKGETPGAPVNGACGSADGTAVTSMPTGLAQCNKGQPALAISSSSSFSWTCASRNSGSDASCYATRGYNVTAVVSGGNGTITSANPVGVAVGSNATITVSPSNGYSPVFSSQCGGSASGSNSFTTGSVSGPCTVTVAFSNNVPGNCGSYTNNVKTMTPLSAGACTSSVAATGFTQNASTGQYSWTCPGIGSGAAASCSARLYYTVSATDNGSANGDVSPATQDVAKGASATVTATANATYAASLSGCNGTASGSPYTTGAITGNCTVTATFAQSASPTNDPGIGTGLWIPPNSNNVVVADQSGDATRTISYVPGCLNGNYPPSSSSSGCGLQASFTATPSGMATTTTVSVGNGKVLSLRYKAKSTAGQSIKSIKISSGDGGNVGQAMKVWLTTTPTASYDSTSTACKALASTLTTSPILGTGGVYCPLTPNGLYYLNISVDSSCPNCRYQVYESTSDFQ